MLSFREKNDALKDALYAAMSLHEWKTLSSICDKAMKNLEFEPSNARIHVCLRLLERSGYVLKTTKEEYKCIPFFRRTSKVRNDLRRSAKPEQLTL